MVYQYLELIVKIISIGLVTAAAGLWAGAGVTSRPKNRDEQTLIGGAIWSQIIIPIGLMISKVVRERIETFVVGYFLTTGILLLWITGVVLIVHESRRYKRRQRREELRHAMHKMVSFKTVETSENSSNPQTSRTTQGFFNRAEAIRNEMDKIKYPYDKAYYSIGILCIMSGAVKVAELIMFVILDLPVIF